MKSGFPRPNRLYKRIEEAYPVAAIFVPVSEPGMVPAESPRRFRRAVESSDSMENIVYFDVETQRSAAEVGGWHNARDMGVSVAVTYNTRHGNYTIYSEKQLDTMLTELQRADLVVGFNILRFDYEVLHGYTILDLTQLPTLDLLIDLQNRVKHRLSLDAVAGATFGAEKTADGLQAIRWFQEGQILKIAEYCCYDVKLTRLVHEFGRQNRRIFYQNRFGVVTAVPVTW